ncbi:MAG: hypothetical protein LBS51_03745, partial [Oscillospiraceae bacterium]|nr:hypothetical protein [Oscillospiraceae bacterium]
APTANAEGDAPPVIERHPSDGTFAKSATLRLYVTAYSQTGGALEYEWSAVDEHDVTVIIPPKDNGKSVLTTTTPSAAGTYKYSVTVTDSIDGGGTTVSSAATIKIVDRELKPEIQNGNFTDYPTNVFPSVATYTPANGFWNTTHDGTVNDTTSGYVSNTGYKKILEVLPASTYGLSQGNTDPAGNATGNLKTAELSSYAPSSLYQEIATVPGKIYEWSLDHGARTSAPSDPQLCAVVIGPAINGEADYTDRSIANNRWIDDAAAAPDGVYPYGRNYTTFFYDVVSQLAVDTFGEGKDARYFATAMGKNAGGAAYTTVYGGSTYYIYISSDLKDAYFTHRSGVYTVPDGQGTTVFGFVPVTTDAGAGNILDNIKFASATPPQAEQAATYTGDTSVTVDTQTGYAYTLAEVRGSSVRTLDGLTASYDNDGAPEAWQPLDVAANAALGDGVSWYTDAKPAGGVDFTTGGELTFDDLTPGKTYRVIGVPASAISKTLHTNQTPADVLDEGCYYDVKIIPAPTESDDYVAPLAAGTYVDTSDGDTVKAFVTLANSRGDTEYALLGADEDGEPYTATPVSSWRLGGGTLRFNNLALSSTYFLVARPVGYTEVTYEDAAYTSTRDVFARKVQTPQADEDLTADQVKRSNVNGTELITITDTKPGWTYALVNVTSGGIVASVKETNDNTVIFDAAVDTIDEKETYQVVAKPTDISDYMAGVRAYPFPTAMEVDYARDRIKSATGAIPKTVEYMLGAADYIKKSGEYYIDLTAAQLDAAEAYRTITYRFSPDDGYTDAYVQPESTLEFPQRPAAPLTSDYTVNYTAETIKAKDDIALEYSVTGGWGNIASGGAVGFTAAGWTESADKTVSLRFPAVEDAAFASKTVEVTIVKRPAAPDGLYATLSGFDVDTKAVFKGFNAERSYSYSVNGGAWETVTLVNEMCELTYPDPNTTYAFRYTATSDAPASFAAAVVPSALITVAAVNFDAATYGYNTISALPVKVKNVHDSESIDVTLKIIDGVTADGVNNDAGNFSFASMPTPTPITVGAGNTNETVAIKPVDGLPAGTYRVKIEATYTAPDGGNSSVSEADVTFIVGKAEWIMPSAGTVSDVSESGFTVSVTGAPEGATLEFRLGAEGVWAEDDDAVGAGGDASYTFKNLTA